ncbi:NUDIX hydrolase [Streptomyces sp. NPDC001276]|uniref:NUDIX hydrolase n=1 Tax=Streptomyces sp. NPDC001276 TaxID=3364555 RepID=UPI00369A6BA1
MQLPDSLRLIDGRLIFPDSVCVLHVNGAGEMLLVRQDRATHDRYTLELPGGKVEEGESHVEAALRELFEESGCVANDAEELLTLDMDFSVSVHRTHLVRVHKLVMDARHTAEFGLVWMSVEEALGQVLEGTLTHAPTVAGILLLAREGRAER